MKTNIFYILIFTLCVVGLFLFSDNKPLVQLAVQPTSNKYVGRIELESISIRLLVLKHCPDSIADRDGQEAIQVANLAASKGLTISSIGNYHVDIDGKTQQKLTWSEKYSYSDLDGLKKFISDQMKIDAKPDDTFIVYTIGHGSGNGSIMRLGQRAGVMTIIAEAAVENQQETLWWQLSCHAAAKLPSISSLTEEQQSLFSMIASSPADELSYFCTQGARMEKVFNAIADKSPDIDPNRDEVITAGELSDFIAKNIGEKYGDLVFAKSRDELIFGWSGRLVNSIPIVNHNSAQGSVRVPTP